MFYSKTLYTHRLYMLKVFSKKQLKSLIGKGFELKIAWHANTTF